MRISSHTFLTVLVLFFIGATCSSVHAFKFRYIEFEILTLPVWRYHEADQDTVGYYPGGGLWPDGLLPEKGADYIIAANEEFRKSRLERKYPVAEMEEEPVEEEIYDPEVRYLVDTNDELPELPVANQIDSLSELPEDVLKQILADRPTDRVMDPQNFLQGQRVNDIMRFLEVQSSQASFDIYTVVLPENQTLPETDLQELHQRWFGDDYSALIVYHVNAPGQTRLLLGDRFQASVVEKLTNQITVVAAEMPAPEDQLEALAIELSIQLYGMERPDLIATVVEPIAQPEEMTFSAVTASPEVIEKIELIEDFEMVEEAELRPVAQIQTPEETIFTLNRPIGPVEVQKETKFGQLLIPVGVVIFCLTLVVFGTAGTRFSSANK